MPLRILSWLRTFGYYLDYPANLVKLVHRNLRLVALYQDFIRIFLLSMLVNAVPGNILMWYP
jgi:hypothetical protein